MFLLVVKLVLSLAAIIICADWMTSGASAIATKMKVSPFIIGLTVVAMGTSAPELFVSVTSALNTSSAQSVGMGDIAIGNVVGSNIFNNLLIVGCVSLTVPLVVSKTTVKRDLPIVTLSSFVLLLFLLDGDLTRLESYALFAAFIIYMWWTIHHPSESKPPSNSPQPPSNSPRGGEGLSIDSKAGSGEKTYLRPSPPRGELEGGYRWASGVLAVAVGLAGLIVASDYFVAYASDIAFKLSVSQKVVGLTIVGAGTSAPELATSIMAARKGQGEMAIGNVIGSNIFNILMVLGLTGCIQPLHGLTVNYIDLGVMTLAAALFWLFSFTKYTLERWEGAVLLALCGGYIWFLAWGAG